MNRMSFTYLSPPNQCHIFPNPSIKSIQTWKLLPSNPNFITFLPPLKYNKDSMMNVNVGGNLHNENDGSEELHARLKQELMPKYIAIISDGNRRWAQQKGWSGMSGYDAGKMTLMHLLRGCCKLKIKVVSLFIFSTENWLRPPEEVDYLMNVIEDLLRIDGEELFGLGCRVSVIGNKAKLSTTLQKLSEDIEEKSLVNSGTHVNFAINYSGKHDITQACRSITTKVKDGVLFPNQINENIFKQELETKLMEFPYPDLVIRTSGEIRLSNFMLWQMAYSELYFINEKFPDFKENDLIEILLAFQEKKEEFLLEK